MLLASADEQQTVSNPVMKRTSAALLFVIASLACEPGPLPANTPRPRDDRSDRFPSESLKPWPLDQAILDSDLERLRALLEKGADPNKRWGQSGDRFPLQDLLDHHGAPRPDTLDAARLLIEHGAGPNARWCPFNSRSKWGNRAGCVSASGATPLMFAAAAGLGDVVELLLNAGADPAATDWNGGSALDYAIGVEAFEHISRRLFPEMATRNQHALSYVARHDPTKSGNPLQPALTDDDAAWYDIPVAPYDTDDFELNAMRFRGTKHLRRARRIETLLAFGADPNRGRPLAWALAGNNYGAARALLAAGANVNDRQCGPDTYLTSPSCTPQNGITLLTWMASKGDQAAVELLLAFGADASLKDWSGRTAEDLAFTDAIRSLVKRR